MSRIGKKPITIPKGVTIKVVDASFSVSFNGKPLFDTIDTGDL